MIIKVLSQNQIRKIIEKECESMRNQIQAELDKLRAKINDLENIKYEQF